MAFHVPFNQRQSARQARPIYIGFEVPSAPQLPRRKFNWWGFNGMWMSFASLLTAGFLSPIPLLVSLKGLRRPGKKMAAVGTLISLAGIGLATAIVVTGIAAHRQHEYRRHADHVNRTVKKQVAETRSLLATATGEIAEYRDSNAGELPNDIDANMLVIKHVDPWGESLRFDAEADHALVRSAGPDRSFDTSDDVFEKVNGRTERTSLLPVDKAQ